MKHYSNYKEYKNSLNIKSTASETWEYIHNSTYTINISQKHVENEVIPN